MQRITEDSEVEEVMKYLGVGEEEELRESSRREENLEKFAQLRSRNPQTRLNIEDTHTAFVEVEEGDIDEFLNITVTSRKFPQIKTDLPEEYHDYLLQKAMTGHEVGHILYSSWPVMKKHMDKVEQEEDHDTEQYVSMFQNFFNALEDGAIENFLAEDFRLEEEILAMRSTLHEETYFGKEYTVGEETEYHYPFFFAIMAACINFGIYDNGEVKKLIDEDNEKFVFGIRGMDHERDMFIDKCLPRIRKDIPKIQMETDAEKRGEIIYDLWDYLRDYIDRSGTPGKTEFEREQENQEGDSYLPGVPENMSDTHGGQDGEPVAVGVDDEDDSEGGEPDQTPGEAAKEKVESGDDGSSSGSNMEQKGKRGVMTEAKQEGAGDWSDEIEEIINALGAGDGIEEIVVAEDGVVDQNRKQQAERQGRKTARRFRRRLHQLQKDKTVRGKRRGKFDERALIDAERGSTRAFKQVKEGDNKDYSCIVVTDRSGSMSGRIDEVELAVGAIAWGLEENGIDTSVLDTHNSKTTLSKPFGTETEEFQEKLFAGRCGGGTPLRYTMRFARNRMDRGSGNVPFAIVITDGKPRRTDEFKEEVKKANFPVLGLYLTDSKSGVKDQLGIYDKAVAVKSDDDIAQSLINLINKIMF